MKCRGKPIMNQERHLPLGNNGDERSFFPSRNHDANLDGVYREKKRAIITNHDLMSCFLLNG